MSLYELFVDPKESQLKYALLSDEEFAKTTVGDLASATKEQMAVVWERLQHVEDKKGAPPASLEDMESITLSQFRHLSAQDINENMEKIPPSMFCVMTKEQVAGLDLEKASAAQIKTLISTDNNRVNRERCERLSPGKVSAIIGEFNAQEMNHLSDAQIQGLDKTKLTPEVLAKLFGTGSVDVFRKRFELFPKDTVDYIFDRMDPSIARFISDKQLVELDPAKFTKENLKFVFEEKHVTGAHEDNIRRFSSLPVSTLHVIMDKFESYHYRLFSPVQIAGLDPEKMKFENWTALFPYASYGAGLLYREDYKKDFSNLPSTTVNAMIAMHGAKLADILTLLSPKHYQELDVDPLVKDNLKYLFRTPAWGQNNAEEYEKNKLLFSYLSSDKANKLFDLLDEYRMSLLSNEQIRDLNPNKLTEEKLKILFPNQGEKDGIRFEINKRRFENFPDATVAAILNTLNTYELSLLSDIQISNLNKEQVQAVKDKLDLVTLARFQSVR